MYNFLLGIYNEINDKCSLCDVLILKIKSIKDFFIVDDMFLINDYVYYPQKNSLINLRI